LEYLNLSDNRINSLDTINNFTNLINLDLSHNRIEVKLFCIIKFNKKIPIILEISNSRSINKTNVTQFGFESSQSNSKFITAKFLVSIESEWKLGWSQLNILINSQ
jgi:Leucine-rich repeat (LRR) protein